MKSKRIYKFSSAAWDCADTGRKEEYFVAASWLARGGKHGERWLAARLGGDGSSMIWREGMVRTHASMRRVASPDLLLSIRPGLAH